MALPFLLVQKGFSGEEIDAFLEPYRFFKHKRKKAFINKLLITWAFVKIAIKEDPAAITPKNELYKAFQSFIKWIGYDNPRYKFPRVGPKALTMMLSQFGVNFTETRTWRQGTQVRAYKGLTLRG